MAQISCSAIHIQDTLPQVPSILTILAIDTNLTVLEFIKKTCNQDGIQVVAYSESLSAVNALKERKEHIDCILIEVDMPIMDGYEFLDFVKKEQINVPLIMMSSDDRMASRLRALKLGAYDYWIKPLQEFEFKSMRKHLLKKCITEDTWQKNSGCLIRRISDNSELASSMVHRSNSNFEEGDDVDESCNPPPTKKPRVVWDDKLHGAFLSAIQKIGIENAVPKKILELMNDPRLERGHVASHLQKYRKSLRQQQQKEQKQHNDSSFDSARQIQRPQQNDMSQVSRRQIEQQPQQNDMSLVSWRQIQQQQQNDMSLVSRRQIEQQSQQNDMSLISWRQIQQPQQDDMFLVSGRQIEQQPQQNDMSLGSWRQIQQQQQQNDMSLVSWGQIEQQQSQQNDMSCVSWNTEPRMCAVERIQLQPSATAITNFHSGFTGNMAHDHPLPTFDNIAIAENCSEEQSNPNTQLAENFYAEEALAHLDDASTYGLLSPSDTVLVEDPTMQQPMHHNQMYPMNFQPSSSTVSGNPAFVSPNYNFGMNMNHGSQSRQDGNNIGDTIPDQCNTRASVYCLQFQNTGLPSGAGTRFAANDFRSQNPYVDGNNSITNESPQDLSGENM